MTSWTSPGAPPSADQGRWIKYDASTINRDVPVDVCERSRAAFPKDVDGVLQRPTPESSRLNRLLGVAMVIEVGEKAAKGEELVDRRYNGESFEWEEVEKERERNDRGDGTLDGGWLSLIALHLVLLLTVRRSCSRK